jgi:CRP/FNR family transcriptional regulator, cyclic AMP receptor protein
VPGKRRDNNLRTAETHLVGGNGDRGGSRDPSRGANGLTAGGDGVGHRLLRSLPSDGHAAPVGISTRKLRRHDVLYRPGDPAGELFVVQSGTIGIASATADGREALIALLGRGELFALCSLFDGGSHANQARAVEASTVVAVPYDAVRRVLEQRPTLLWGLMRIMAGRLRLVDQALADSVFLDVTGRTAKRLLELSGNADEFHLPITQEELAALVGASRERVNKSIATFVRLGWMEQRDRRYRIVDRTQLVRRAGQAGPNGG